MHLAVFSDVHGNLTALQAVVDHIEKNQEVERVFCAGDICCFGPRPMECLEFIVQRRIPAVVGNTDEWIRNPPAVEPDMDEEQKRSRQNIQDWCQWTSESLGNNLLVKLDSIRHMFERRISPSDITADDLLLVHANPKDLMQVIFPPVIMQKEQYGGIRQSDSDLEPLLADVNAAVLAFGHLHVPSIRQWRDLLLVNVSSVSLPGDGDYRAKYAVLTWSKESGWQAEHFRVDYEVADEIEAYRERRPPGWEKRVEELRKNRSIPQVV